MSDCQVADATSGARVPLPRTTRLAADDRSQSPCHALIGCRSSGRALLATSSEGMMLDSFVGQKQRTCLFLETDTGQDSIRLDRRGSHRDYPGSVPSCVWSRGDLPTVRQLTWSFPMVRSPRDVRGPSCVTASLVPWYGHNT